MPPHLAGHDNEHGQERPSLPSIRDLFGEHLAHKRLSPFSLAELGTSLPAESRPSSPAESQGSLFLSNLTSPRTACSLASSHSAFRHACADSCSPRRHSDTGSHLLTTPSTSSSKDHFLTLPPIQAYHQYSYQGRRASNPYIMPPLPHRTESHGRSRSSSEAMTARDIRLQETALDASENRRHTIGSTLGSAMQFPYPIESYSGSLSTGRHSTHSRLPSASRLSVTNPYPAASTHPSLPCALHSATGFSPPSSRPPSPSFATSGDEAPGSKKSAAKYQCQYCGKRFNRPSSLKLHHNTHTGEKPYACPFPDCGRHFSVMSNMRRHARIHGDLPARAPREGSVEDIADTASTAYSSSSSTHNTPVISQATIFPSYSHSHSSSASSSPHGKSGSLPSSSTWDGRRRRSSVTRPHPYRWSPSSEEGDSSPEQ